MLRTPLLFRLLAVALILLAGLSHAQVTNSPAPIDVYDGFETTSLSKLWSTDRFEPGAVQMQTNFVRAGRSAAEVVVHSRDKFEAGSPGTSGSERAELMEAIPLTAIEGAAYEQSFSMFFPTNFPIVPTRLVIAQWKQYCPNDPNCADESPVLAVRYISGELRITQDLDKKQIVLFRQKDEFRGRWLDFKFQVRFATNDTGRVKAWLGGKPLLDYRGVTANSENPARGYTHPSHFCFKMGLYRNATPEPWTFYIDEYRKKRLPAGEL
jgi:hypothetical protein